MKTLDKIIHFAKGKLFEIKKLPKKAIKEYEIAEQYRTAANIALENNYLSLVKNNLEKVNDNYLLPEINRRINEASEFHTKLIAKDSYYNPEISKNQSRLIRGGIHNKFPDSEFTGYDKPKKFFN